MALENAISDITGLLRQGKFPNEQAISQGIVLRVFQELGWNTWNTNIIWPEYQTGEGRVDFAICHPPSKPSIFIEVKQPGKAEDAVRQALEYAFHTGVPFVVLTDGRSWGFYLPAEQGSYEERRVYKLDLYERTPSEAGEILRRYLEPAKVESGEALETARKEYRSRNRRSRAKEAISDAWVELVEKGDELLVEILTSAVESKIGVRPEVDDVAEFLSSLGKFVKIEVPSAKIFIPPAKKSISTRSGELTLLGKTYFHGNAKDAMVIILRELAKKDSTFLERCSQHPDSQGRKRKYIARTAEELYPDREDLRELRAELPGGWLVATNLNNILKKSIIRLAANVAKLSFGKDIVVDF